METHTLVFFREALAQLAAKRAGGGSMAKWLVPARVETDYNRKLASVVIIAKYT